MTKPIQACWKKRVFDSKESARIFAKENQLRLIAYVCPWGNHVHLAHRRHA